jgi:hypothetical protein
MGFTAFLVGTVTVGIHAEHTILVESLEESAPHAPLVVHFSTARRVDGENHPCL